ncbi:MAG: hypothetical protein GY937_20745 [bacterium]|nr:hypothetical protein [bacterium]
MKFATTWTRAARADYFASVDFLLQLRFRTSVAERLAESVVTAAWRAGFSPRECVEWLAAVDGL